MARFGIIYKGEHSHASYGLTVADKEIGNPSKLKVKKRVPFSNEIYDFSGLYGGQEYSERKLTYVFNVKDYDKVNLSMKKAQLINWLMPSEGKLTLEDDFIPGYYFLAEIEEEPDFSEFKYNGTVTVTFTANPFMICEREEGHDIWDEFNFFLDSSFYTSFSVTGRKAVTLYNVGATIAHPIIEASLPMQIIKDGKTYNVPSGKSSSLDFFLERGPVNLTLVGNADVTFKWYKEMI